MSRRSKKDDATALSYVAQIALVQRDFLNHVIRENGLTLRELCELLEDQGAFFRDMCEEIRWHAASDGLNVPELAGVLASRRNAAARTPARSPRK